MPTIAFVEVEADDLSHVTEKYPDALTSHENIQDPDALAMCKEAEVLSIFIYSTIDEATLKQLPKLKVLCTRSVGVDHIDLAACEKRGITVCNVPDYGSHVIAEHVFALLLSTIRHILKGDERVEQGEFDYNGLRGMALQGKTLGIVGTGKIGMAVAHIARGFGMNIIATDRCRNMHLVHHLGIEYVSFEELLAQSDIITLHLPAVPETEHMINEHTISQMKDGAILVNTARGSLIDSTALVAALDSGKLAHALLDVLEHEKNFEESKALIKHPNAVTTPHIAFYADDSMKNMYLDCFESIDQWLSGRQPEHVVKPPDIICDLPGVQPS